MEIWFARLPACDVVAAVLGLVRAHVKTAMMTSCGVGFAFSFTVAFWNLGFVTHTHMPNNSAVVEKSVTMHV